MIEITLYHTTACHLCELAQQLIEGVQGVIVHLIDIAEDAALVEAYGVRIPVLKRTDTGAELG